MLHYMRLYVQRKAFQPFKSHDALKHHFTSLKTHLIFSQLVVRMKISMILVYQYMAIFFNFSPTTNHLHPLQVENCDSNSRLVEDEDDNGKFRLERVKSVWIAVTICSLVTFFSLHPALSCVTNY